MSLKLEHQNDAGKKSDSAVFFDWQMLALEAVPDYPDLIENKAVWLKINEAMSISRASVINFMNSLLDMGLLRGVEKTGKGGPRWAYQFESDREYFDKRVCSVLCQTLAQEFPDFNLEKMSTPWFNRIGYTSDPYFPQEPWGHSF